MERKERFQYHLFGDLWLEEPDTYLSSDELLRLKSLEASIRRLEDEPSHASRIDLQKAFLDFANREQAAWRLLGAERSQDFLVYPSGEINVTIACHLHNPTFYVKNPYCKDTDNGSNPTIQQINQAGFSSKNTFIFDHICRRERTEDVLLFWTEDIIQIHEEFMFSLRDTMTAKVEICWGKNVRERMMASVNLVPLKLWGTYEDVDLYLEMKNDAVVRFVIFVCHPQRFFYYGRNSEVGTRVRETIGRRQDQYLSVASKLAGIDIPQNLYETYHRPATYGKLEEPDRLTKNRLEAEAEVQLRAAFPDRSKKLQSSPGLSEELESIKATVWDSETLIQAMHGEARNEALRRFRVLDQMSRSLEDATCEVLGNTRMFQSSNHEQISIAVKSSDWDEVCRWEDVPLPLISWLQDQDGLKIDNVPMSSIDDLIMAYRLLGIQEPTAQSIMEVIFKVAIRYMFKVSPHGRRLRIQDLIIPGAKPHNIMARKCSICGGRVLDDAFACYSKTSPKTYITFYSNGSGCGRLHCTGFANFVPVSPRQSYKRASRPIIERQGAAEWEAYLLRSSAEELQGLPETVTVKCASCQKEIIEDNAPRWTAEDPARYVTRRPKCDTCGVKFASWLPVKDSITTIPQSSVAKKWSDLRKGGIDFTKYPRRPDIYWSKKNHSTKIKELEEASGAIGTERRVKLRQPNKRRKLRRDVKSD